MSEQTAGVTRRSLLKGAGAIAAGAAMGGMLSMPTVSAFAKTENAANTGERGVVYGHCRMCMMCGACGFVGTVKDGVVVNVEGDPDRKTNAGTMCPRGKSMITNLYNPHRIKAPMKRTNPEKGMEVDPGWVEISWDEALDIAAEKIRGCYDTDIRKLINMFGFASYEATHAATGVGLWAKKLGTPNTSSTKGEMCAIHYGGSYVLSCHPTVVYDALYCKMIISLGKSEGFDGAMGGGDARQMAANIRNGVRYITVGPRATMDASRTEWVSCRLGSELALIYSWMYCMLYEIENGFDEPFVKSRTNAPYLIDAAGDYVRNSDGRPIMYDQADGEFKDFTDETLTDPALFGTFDYEGTSCTPGFQLFKEALKDFTPEWAEAYCTVPAEKIRELVNDLVTTASFGATVEIDGQTLPLRPACVMVGRGVCNQEDGTLTDIWSRVLNVLLGNVGYPGGITSNGEVDYYTKGQGTIDGTTEPYLTAFTAKSFTWPPQALNYSNVYPHLHTTNTLMMRTICDPEKYGFDYKPEVMVSQGANPIACTADPEIAIEAMKKLYVIYSACYHMDEMAMMSDLLLPDHALLEQHTVHQFAGVETITTTTDPDYLESNHAILVRKGIGPMYNTMDANDQILEIFDRMGLNSIINTSINANGFIGVCSRYATGQNPAPALPFGQYEEYKLDVDKHYTAEEIWDRNLKSQFGPDKGLDYLDEVKFIPVGVNHGANFYPSYRNSKVRLCVYLEAQKRSGDNLIPGMQEVQDSGFDLEGLLKYEIAEFRRRYQAIPYWPEHRKIDNQPEEYKYFACNYRIPIFLFRMASMDQDPVRRDYSERYMPDDNAVLMNTLTAQEEGISEGDLVLVESPFGHTQGKAHVTETIRPDTIAIGGARGRHTSALGEGMKNDTNYNALMSGDFGYRDALHGGVIDTVRVKISKVEG